MSPEPPSSPTRGRGRPRGSTTTTAQVCVRVPSATYDRVYSIARDRDCSVPAVLRAALRRELDARLDDDDDD